MTDWPKNQSHRLTFSRVMKTPPLLGCQKQVWFGGLVPFLLRAGPPARCHAAVAWQPTHTFQPPWRTCRGARRRPSPSWASPSRSRRRCPWMRCAPMHFLSCLGSFVGGSTNFSQKTLAFPKRGPFDQPPHRPPMGLEVGRSFLEPSVSSAVEGPEDVISLFEGVMNVKKKPRSHMDCFL